MRNSRSLLISLVFGIGALSAVALLSAATDTTVEATLFHDGFESLGDDVSHSAFPDETGDYDPIAATGNWSVSEDGTHESQVTDHIGGFDPGPFLGSNYLRLVGGVCYMNFTTTQSSNGDHIHIEHICYVNSTGDSCLAVHGCGSAGEHRFTVVTSVSSGRLRAYYDDAYHILPGVSYANKKWQKWEIDYIVGDSTFSLTIDGTTQNGIPLRDPGESGDLSKVYFSNAAARGKAYLDECRVIVLAPSRGKPETR